MATDTVVDPTRLADAIHAAGLWWPKGEAGVRFAARVLSTLDAGNDVTADGGCRAGEVVSERAEITSLRSSCEAWQEEAHRYAQNDLDRPGRGREVARRAGGGARTGP